MKYKGTQRILHLQTAAKRWGRGKGISELRKRKATEIRCVRGRKEKMK